MAFKDLLQASDATYMSLFGEEITLLLSGEEVATLTAIVNINAGHQMISGVGLVASEPSMVVKTADAATITPSMTIMIDGEAWQTYGDQVDDGFGLTTFSLIRV